MPSQHTIYVHSSDNHKLAVHQIGQPQQDRVCFLTHGTFSDKRICLGLANFLAQHHYTCYILEWRNHGDSEQTSKPFDFETIAIYDIKAVFDHLCHQLNITHIHAITHSGGGICLTMFLCRYRQFVPYVRSMTLVACQAFLAGERFLPRLRLLLLKQLTKLLGFVPARQLGLGITSESYHTMKLWFDWNLSRKFDSHIDDTNYQHLASTIAVPVYAICGSGDTFIAPVHGCDGFFQLFAHPSNQFGEFGMAFGHLENYNHSRIMLSKNASTEVWASILSWLNKHTG